MVCGPLAAKFGGPSSVARNLSKELAHQLEVSLFGIAGSNERAELESEFPGINLFAQGFPRSWFRGVGLRAALAARRGEFDLYHAHMVWDHCVLAAWRESIKADKPFYITPHGTFNELWRWNSTHKKAYKKLLIDPMIESGANIHCLTKAEEDKIKEAFPSASTFVVPNGISSEYFLRPDKPRSRSDFVQHARGKRVITYLGRLWSEKGLDVLPEAFKVADVPDSILILAGPDYKGFKDELRERIRALGIEDRVVLPGLLNFEDKLSLLNQSDLFILASKSEGLSMSLIEASAVGVPSIISEEIFFDEYQFNPGGQTVKREVNSLGYAIKDFFETSPETSLSLRQKTSAWAKRNFHSDNTIERLVSHYDLFR